MNGDKVPIKPGRNLKVKKMIAERYSTSGRNIKIKRKRKDGHSTSGRNIKIKRKGSERFIIAKNLWLRGICEGITRSENVAPWKCFFANKGNSPKGIKVRIWNSGELGM